MFVQNQENVKIYKEIRAILEGCDTIVDAVYFGKIYIDKYPFSRDIVNGIISGKTYTDSIDIRTKQDLLRDILLQDNQDDAVKLITKLEKLSSDDVYKQTLNRIARRKHVSHIEKIITENLLYKNCPHCSHLMRANVDANYVICGYNDTKLGYDWHGCGKDWCFSCGKMLCKSWHNNALHCDANRIHTSTCCQIHATENNKKYEEEYCQCNNLYVRRGVDMGDELQLD